SKMRELVLPVWCLEEVDTLGIYDIVQKYIEFAQKEGSEAHNKAIEIGRIALNKPSLATNLPNLITSENCKKGMLEYLRSFEGGRLLDLAEAIRAQNDILKDIKRLFSVKHSCLWDKQTGESEIRKLLVEYGIVKATNSILNTAAHSLSEAYKEWRERLNFIGISCEALQSEYPSLAKVLDMLLKIYNQDEILLEQLKDLHFGLNEHEAELIELLNNDLQLFYEVYNVYLEDFREEDITKIKANAGRGLFGVKRTDSNIRVKNAAESYKKEQLVTQLLTLWRKKTGTKNPNEWSNLYKTPILCLVQPMEFEKAKKAFDTLNRNGGADGEINAALAYLKETTIFNLLHDNDKRDEAFKKDILGIYSTLLTDINKVRDELSYLQVDVYNWRGNPEVQNRIKQLAKAEYDAGGSNKVLSKIDNMSDVQLKEYLKLLIKDNVTVGLEILRDRG
ncbi:MAG TPA: hypothetical protein PLE79_06560, partial [Clostridia bacterium]|nr:hypothetical protein [Clostridia bacterium]